MTTTSFITDRSSLRWQTLCLLNRGVNSLSVKKVTPVCAFLFVCCASWGILGHMIESETLFDALWPCWQGPKWEIRLDLAGKRVAVSGGSDGIGRHICLKLAEAGCELAILGRDIARLEAVKREVESVNGARAHIFAADLNDTSLVSGLSAQIVSQMGGLDILINNAGVWHKSGPLDTIDEAMLLQTVQVNLTAAMILTRNVLPTLRAQDEAAVLNVISKSGVIAQAGQSVYTASKYGMRGFTDVLKEDEAESGVRVAGLYQSGTNTGMFAKAAEDVPNHIFTEPDDLADLVVFMLSRPAKLWMHEVRVEL